LANLVIIKAAIISCTCDHVTGPYRLVHCRQPYGSTLLFTLLLYSGLQALDIMRAT